VLFKPTCALKQLIYREAPDALIAKRYWESIKASVLTSFYTDTRIVSAIATALATTGVEFHSCLDPSSEIGAFADTFAPYAHRVDALKKDLLTAQIAQALHPLGESKVTVRQAPFESLGELAEADRYDLITSNIPSSVTSWSMIAPTQKGKIASSGRQHAPSTITSSSKG